MIATGNNEQHRSGERQGWGSLWAAANALHTSIALDHEQDWSACDGRAGMRAQRHVGYRGPDRTGGIAMLPVHPLQFARLRSLPGGSSERRLVCIPCGRAATLSRRLSGCRLQFHRIGYQLPGYVSDPFERHERLSQSVGFNTDEHKRGQLEPCSLNRGKSFPG